MVQYRYKGQKRSGEMVSQHEEGYRNGGKEEIRTPMFGILKG